MRPIPFRLFLLAHPQSESAKRLAQELMKRFVDPPASGGLRLPVFFTPENAEGLPPGWEGDRGIDLDQSDHTLVIVLSDARMAQLVDNGTGSQWTEFLEEGIEKANRGVRHMAFGIAIGREGYLISGDRHMFGIDEAPPVPPKNPTTEEEKKLQDGRIATFQAWLAAAADTVALQIAVRAVQLLQPDAQARVGRQRKVKLFLSHAKADLGAGDANADEADAVRNVELAVQELAVEFWFDAKDIPPAEKFEEEIKNGIQDCSIVIVFLTDQYASRPYCQWEVLASKELEVPILVVDALVQGERRNFPYLGNVPTIHWSGADRKAQAFRIVLRAIRETLRFRHNRACLKAFWNSSPNASVSHVVLPTSPEAFILTKYEAPSPDAGKQVFVYPDPPLTVAEKNVLTALRNADFVTPLTQLARTKRPASMKTIAVSISDSAELAKFGLSSYHEQTLTDEIHLSLLMAGFQIAYGGRLDPPQLGPTNNFTLRLFDLVRGYSQLASNSGTTLEPILNIPPWPLLLSYTTQTYKLFGKVAKLQKGQRPPESEIPDTEDGVPVFPPKAGASGEIEVFKLPDTPLRRLAWTRGLTLMRQQMTRETQARLVIGGKLAGFSGLYPGVVEEAWLSIVANQDDSAAATRHPLFLVGSLGGAAQAVIDLLDGKDRSEVRQPSLGPNAPALADILTLAVQRGITLLDATTPISEGLNLIGRLVRPEKMAADIQKAGASGLTNALRNGLTDDENRELFRAKDPQGIAELILTGLSRLSP